ncbi:MAG: metal-dependent hydrolase [Pseudomonadota bacterium]
MANYATHIGVGTVVSGAMATLTLAADILSPDSLMAVTLAGVVGSFLPDIDLKDSRASRILFSGFAFFFGFCAMFIVAPKVSIVELWVIVGVLFLTIRYGMEAAFHRFSYHRGIWHSLLAAFFFASVTAIVFHYILGKHPGVAWLAGGFMFVGYITHLVLDELYSVDLMDRRLKLSFGSALKLADFRKPGETSTVAALAVIAFLLAPPTRDFVDGLTSQEIWGNITAKWTPDDAWFGVITRDGAASGSATVQSTGSISTGSIRRESD